MRWEPKISLLVYANVNWEFTYVFSALIYFSLPVLPGTLFAEDLRDPQCSVDSYRQSLKTSSLWMCSAARIRYINPHLTFDIDISKVA